MMKTFKQLKNNLPESKSSSGYDLYHRDFSSAMQHAYKHAKVNLGVDVDPDEIDRKVAMGPRKPSKGKTNSYRLLDKDGKKAIQVQVYGMDNGKYELNMYKESVEANEAKIKTFSQLREDIAPVNENASKALAYATKAHKGQFRSDGSEYIKHPERVADYVKKFKKSHNLDALISAAFLHDTIEDTDTTHEDLEKMFGGLVAGLVKELTTDNDEKNKVGKKEYLSSKMETMSSYALVIKLADRLDNVSDIATARTPEWRAMYKDQTLGILNRLKKNRELSGTHKKLIKAIEKKLDEVK